MSDCTYKYGSPMGSTFLCVLSTRDIYLHSLICGICIRRSRKRRLFWGLCNINAWHKLTSERKETKRLVWWCCPGMWSPEGARTCLAHPHSSILLWEKKHRRCQPAILSIWWHSYPCAASSWLISTLDDPCLPGCGLVSHRLPLNKVRMCRRGHSMGAT